jgi:hypothetical protein
MLPDFIIIGVVKGGTTSLHHYFDQHPDVFMTVVKEPNYFSFDEDKHAHVTQKHMFRVRSQLEYERLFTKAAPTSKKGEASPSYFRSSVAPLRIKETIPDCRLIVSLRNPVDRAYSAYLMSLRSGAANIPVEQIEPGRDRWIGGSLYADPLRRYMKVFDAANFKIVLFDDISHNPRAVMSDLFRFIGVNDGCDIDTSYRFNSGGLPQSSLFHKTLNALKKLPGLQEYTPKPIRRKMAGIRDRNLLRAPPLNPDLRAEWLDYFRDDILQTQDLIQRDLSKWLVLK